MPGPMTSLFWIVLCSVIAPLVAGVVPRRLVPEVVLLLVAGVVIGPNVLGLASTDEAIGLLRQLGLGMLFLLAGYEIELAELVDKGGRRALATWVACLAIAFTTVWVLGHLTSIHAEAAVAIALTSTALGTLLPILRDSGLLPTRFGSTLVHHAAYGELGPVVAMAVLLGTRGAFASIVALVLFGVIAAAFSLPPRRLRREESRLLALIRAGAETTGQTTVRLTLLLLATLGAIALAFQLDGVLGAFAAGFVLRRLVPDGNERLEAKLDGLAFGLLIPVFFVTSGMSIDPAVVVDEPVVLLVFVALILLIRGGPVLLVTRAERDSAGARRFGGRDSLRMGLYAATGLPIIVAVTSVAVSEGLMAPDTASVLVAGAAVTVLALPMTATLLERRVPPPSSPPEQPLTSPG